VALVDPLDGSDVAARGYPLCSISVSIIDLEANTPVLSRIAEVFTGHQFAAFRETATRNDQPIRPSNIVEPHDAFVVSYCASRSRLSKVARDIDKSSAFSLVLDYGGMLDIAKVGSGQCDAMIEATSGIVAREYIGGVHIATAAAPPHPRSAARRSLRCSTATLVLTS
jgi:fructose-1,6-bisphosphatase/inositol monophosphatase family enzyme